MRSGLHWMGKGWVSTGGQVVGEKRGGVKKKKRLIITIKEKSFGPPKIKRRWQSKDTEKGEYRVRRRGWKRLEPHGLYKQS